MKKIAIIIAITLFSLNGFAKNIEKQSFASCSYITIQALNTVRDYQNNVPIEKLITLYKDSSVTVHNTKAIYSLLKKYDLKKTLFEIYTTFSQCVKLIPNYEQKYAFDPYGRCAWVAISNFSIMTAIDKKGSDEFKRKLTESADSKIDAIFKKVKEKNLESVLMTNSDLLRDCTLKVVLKESMSSS